MMSGTETAALVVSLTDKVTGPARQASAAIRAMGNAARSVNATLNKGLMEPFRAVGAAVRSFNAQADAANSAFRRATTEAAVLGAAMALPIRAAARLEDAMADIAKVSGFTATGLTDLRKDLIQLSRETPMAADELAGLAAELAAAGTSDDDLLNMTKLVARVGVAFGMTGEQAGENLGKIRSALGLTVAQTARYADQINALSDGTASSASDLTDFSRRVGSLGKQYGYTTDQVLAFGSAMVSAGATPETAATGFQAVGRALVRGTSATKGQREAFKRLGLTSTKVAKGMSKDALKTTQDVLERIRKLPQWERAAIVNQLFGDEAKTFMPLIENTGLLADSLKILADEGKVSGSVLREFENRIGTTTGKLKQVRNRAMAAGIAFGNALLPSIRETADALGPLLDQGSKFIESNEEMVARLTKVGVGMVAARVALTGLRAGMFAMLRPTNLLLAGLGYLAFTNFDALSGAFRDLKAAATDLAGTQFAKEFLAGAGDALKAAGEGARELVSALREMTGEDTALRQWLDSVDGAGWGRTLGAVAVGLGAIGATAGALAAVAGPLRAIGKAVLVLSGIKPAMALAGWLGGLGQSSGKIVEAAAGLERLNRAAEAAGMIPRPSVWGAAFGALGGVMAMGQVPDDDEGFKAYLKETAARKESWERWLADNVGSPRQWLGLDVPEPVNSKKPAIEPVDWKKSAIEREMAPLDAAIASWPAKAQSAMMDYGQALVDGGAAAETVAAATAAAIRSELTFTVHPDIDTGAFARALALAGRVAAAIRAIEAAPSSAPATAVVPLAGARARGGPVEEGKAYLLGERGPEIGVFGRSGHIVDAARSARLMGRVGPDGAPEAPGHAHDFGQHPGAAVARTGGSATINMPVSVKIEVNGASAADLKRAGEEAAQAVMSSLRSVGHELSRSQDVTFTNIRYGDA